MTLSELQRMKELEAENARLKRILSDRRISIGILKEVNSRKSGQLTRGSAVLLMFWRKDRM